MKHMAADLFDAAGEKWIVLVDRYSGYGWSNKPPPLAWKMPGRFL